jgi:hypothetical protein
MESAHQERLKSKALSLSLSLSLERAFPNILKMGKSTQIT